MDYNFAADSDKLAELVSLIGSAADKIKEYEERIYSIINDMGGNEIWSGEAYDAFKSQCESYRPSIDGLYSILLAFKLQFTKLQDSATTLSDDIFGIVNS